jgi:hypothetical protein
MLGRSLLVLVVELLSKSLYANKRDAFQSESITLKPSSNLVNSKEFYIQSPKKKTDRAKQLV